MLIYFLKLACCTIYSLWIGQKDLLCLTDWHLSELTGLWTTQTGPRTAPATPSPPAHVVYPLETTVVQISIQGKYSKYTEQTVLSKYMVVKYTKRPIVFGLFSRDQLIWQIEEFLYRHSITGMIYHIRTDAFIFFGLWCSHMRAIQPNFGVKLNNSIHLDWITFRLHKLSSFTILHWMTVTFRSIPLWKVVYWNPIVG